MIEQMTVKVEKLLKRRILYLLILVIIFINPLIFAYDTLWEVYFGSEEIIKTFKETTVTWHYMLLSFVCNFILLLPTREKGLPMLALTAVWILCMILFIIALYVR